MARMMSENYHLLSLQHTESSKKGTRADRTLFLVKNAFFNRNIVIFLSFKKLFQEYKM